MDSKAVKAATRRAIDLAGGQSAVARALTQSGKPITPQGVGAWYRGGRIPAPHVLDVERLNQAAAQAEPETRSTLRPDLYPAPFSGHTTRAGLCGHIEK